MLLKAGLKYHASRLLILNTRNIMFLKFKNKKPLKAIKEDFKLNLSIKKVYKIDDESNEIRNNFMTLIK
jgi:hypothetical protein